MIPSPSIAPVPADGSTFRAEWNGPVGAVGYNVPLHISLMYLPKHVRSQPYFHEQLFVEMRSLDAGFIDATPDKLVDANFFDDGSEPNAYVQVFVSAMTGAELCQVIVTLIHSVIR